MRVFWTCTVFLVVFWLLFGFAFRFGSAHCCLQFCSRDKPNEEVGFCWVLCSVEILVSLLKSDSEGESSVYICCGLC